MTSRSKIFILIALFLLSNCNLFAQDEKPGSEVPSGLVSLLIVPDPKCPIQIKGPFRVLGWSYGGLELGYTLQNSSNSDIESFKIEELDLFGGSGYKNSFVVNKDQRFGPGISRYTFTDEALDGFIPFDQNKGLQTHISKPWNKVWIIMVVNVRLADGTSYDATNKFKTLEKFISDVDHTSITRPDRLNKWEFDLREFVSKLMTQAK